MGLGFLIFDLRFWIAEWEDPPSQGLPPSPGLWWTGQRAGANCREFERDRMGNGICREEAQKPQKENGSESDFYPVERE
jgi:hypothetical protein